MNGPRRFGRFLITALPLTALWTIACPMIFDHSAMDVFAIALGVGWLASFWLGCVAAGWIPAPPARPVGQRSAQPSREELERRHQQHLHDQARAAYLMNPKNQSPPPTDNYPGF